jgi:hypothetical protein
LKGAPVAEALPPGVIIAACEDWVDRKQTHPSSDRPRRDGSRASGLQDTAYEEGRFGMAASDWRSP